MWDIIIAVLLGIILVEMARFGGYVSSNPPSDLKVARKYTNRFRVYAILACVLAQEGKLALAYARGLIPFGVVPFHLNLIIQ